MSTGRGSVRIGPVSLLTLVIVLCIATLSVLSVTTAQATYAATERQAAFVEDTYDNEAAAQRFVAEVDAVLADVRSGKTTSASALAALYKALPTLVGDAATEDMSATATMDGSIITASFSKESGRTLDIELSVHGGRTYSITQWKATTRWTEEVGSETLWSGAV